MKRPDGSIEMRADAMGLAEEMATSYRRFPMATKGNAMRLMYLWHSSSVGQSERQTWFDITGETEITTRILWDYIRAALVNGV